MVDAQQCARMALRDAPVCCLEALGELKHVLDSVKL
jgi:hypothetical protein